VREVFAVPGSPLDPRCRGTNDLIRQGATLCEGVDDILRTLDAQMTLFERPAPTVPLHAVSAFDDTDLDEAIDSLRDRLLSLISPVPTPREDLLRLSGAPARVGLAALGELEIAGLIVTTSDGQYIRG